MKFLIYILFQLILLGSFAQKNSVGVVSCIYLEEYTIDKHNKTNGLFYEEHLKIKDSDRAYLNKTFSNNNNTIYVSIFTMPFDNATKAIEADNSKKIIASKIIKSKGKKIKVYHIKTTCIEYIRCVVEEKEIRTSLIIDFINENAEKTYNNESYIKKTFSCNR